jgi:large subunit ribosomal protein L29
MKAKELKQKTTADLQALLQEKREKLGQLSFDLASGKVKNVREIREIKKDIAKILTTINEKSKI